MGPDKGNLPLYSVAARGRKHADVLTASNLGLGCCNDTRNATRHFLPRLPFFRVPETTQLLIFVLEYTLLYLLYFPVARSCLARGNMQIGMIPGVFSVSAIFGPLTSIFINTVSPPPNHAISMGQLFHTRVYTCSHP